MNRGTIGTVSHGTLRTPDLLDSFASELEALVQANADEWCSDAGRAERDAHMSLIGEAREWSEGQDFNAANEERGSELVNALIDALEEFAPDGCYFGAHIGDGSDFGYWPCEDFE